MDLRNPAVIQREEYESNLDIKLGGALAMIEKVFNYPQVDESIVMEDIHNA